jgi:molybdopterin-guanine dinucleotide biosynthesis protein A
MGSSAVTVAILAGGRAERLGGRDKGLEPLLGRPLIAHVVAAIAAMDVAAAFAGFAADASFEAEAADAAIAAPLLIVANRHHDAYARHAPVIGDTVAGFRGPLAGVAAALAACVTPWLLTVPVDCPDPPRALAHRLAAATRVSSAPVFVADDGEHCEPLFALYRCAAAVSAAAATEAGQGVRQWQTTLGAQAVDFADVRQQFLNLNTPEEFAAYAAGHRQT